MDTSQSFFLTGCASGIGRYLCDQLVTRGYFVYATDVNFTALEEAATKGNWSKTRTRLAQLDVRDHEAWNRTFADAINAFEKIDVCMNIAGILKANWVHEVPIDEINAQVDINVKGVIFGTTVAAAHMVERKQGHIMNIASMASLAPIPGLSVYSATKYAVRGYSMAAAAELRQHGVFVTALCPDGVDTPLLDVPSENDAASIIWSGSRLLTVEEIGRIVMDHILPNKPILVALPLSRALLARAADLFPGWAGKLLPFLQKRGREHRFRDRNHQH